MYYITRKDLNCDREGKIVIPKGSLVTGQWDSDSWFRVRLAPFRTQEYSATLPSGPTDKYLRYVADFEIEKGLIAIGILEAKDNGR